MWLTMVQEQAQVMQVRIDTGAGSGSAGANDTAAEVKETPDTADNNSIFVWLLMLSVGGMTVCMAISSKKRRTNG